MIQPILNINGTSADDLINPRRKAIRQIDDLIETLKQVTPNGRDYPGQPERCADDREIHYARCRDLHDLREILMREALAIIQQKDA